jgi:hypothetical protein
VNTTAPQRRSDGTGSGVVPVERSRRTFLLLFRKFAVAITGTVLVIAGVAMLVLPGPGVVVILGGLGLLGTEFPAARRLSDLLIGYGRAAWRKVRRSKANG